MGNQLRLRRLKGERIYLLEGRKPQKNKIQRGGKFKY
jgi:hypothetical protein